MDVDIRTISNMPRQNASNEARGEHFELRHHPKGLQTPFFESLSPLIAFENPGEDLHLVANLTIAG